MKPLPVDGRCKLNFLQLIPKVVIAHGTLTLWPFLLPSGKVVVPQPDTTHFVPVGAHSLAKGMVLMVSPRTAGGDSFRSMTSFFIVRGSNLGWRMALIALEDCSPTSCLFKSCSPR